MAFHRYNTFAYNTAQYNSDVNFWVQLCVETIASADGRIGQPTKVLADTVTSTDANFNMAIKTCAEFMFLADTITKSILNKGLTETVRVNDWLEIERKNQDNGNGWSN